MIYKKLLKELSLVNAGSRLTSVLGKLEGFECAGMAGKEQHLRFINRLHRGMIKWIFLDAYASLLLALSLSNSLTQVYLA